MAVRRGFNHFPAIRRDLERRAAGVVVAAMGNIRERAVGSMGGPKSGRMYGTHQASAPGEAPAIMFGQLANSIDTEMVSAVSGRVFSTAEHAPHLEFGTTQMEPRPFFGPAAEEERADYEAAMRSVLGGLGGGSISGPMSR
jgi:HK97 gp10 family phage protein